MSPCVRVVLCAVALTAGTSGAVLAQSVRGSATSTLRYVSLQPLVRDTFAFAEARLDADGVYRVGGREVTCVEGVRCTSYATGATSHAVAGIQDVRFTAWGFGLEGLSATVFVRGRRQFDGAYPWPRIDDAFDALLAYVQWNRPGVRLRLGRQENRSGLGFASFDGADLLIENGGWLRLEAFGGRSLARGLREPRNEALRGLDDFIPENEAYLFGTVGTFSHSSGATLTLRAQREVWSDGETLLSERASADVHAPLPRGLLLTARGDWDLALDRPGRAGAALLAPLTRGFDAELRLERYVPYFDLSTIWGFFDPVGYREVSARVGLRPRPDVDGWAAAGHRRYEQPSTTAIFRPLEDDAWTVRAGLAWRPGSSVRAQAEYRLEWGAGAYLHSGDVALALRAGRRGEVSVHGSVLQQLEEFRLGDRRMAGGGLRGTMDLGRVGSLEGGFTHFAVLGTDGPDPLVGPQTRAWLGLTVGLGEDPGLRGGSR